MQDEFNTIPRKAIENCLVIRSLTEMNLSWILIHVAIYYENLFIDEPDPKKALYYLVLSEYWYEKANNT